MPPLQWYLRDCSHYPFHMSFPRDSRRGASGDRESRGVGARVVPGNSGGGPHWLALSGDSPGRSYGLVPLEDSLGDCPGCTPSVSFPRKRESIG